MYKNGEIAIRRVRFSDAQSLYEWENNRDFWRISDREEALTQLEIEGFIEEQQSSLFDLDQLRYMIVDAKSQKTIGTVDLYEIDWNEDFAYVGILIADKKDRKRNAATNALIHMMDLSREELELDMLKARVHPDNAASIRLFRKLGFRKKNENADQIMKDGAYIQYFTFEKWLRE